MNSSFSWFVLLFVVTIFQNVVSSSVPVYVMLPLDTVTINSETNNASLKNVQWLGDQFLQLKNNGAHGVMIDCWWGLVEKDAPRKYNFQPYQELIALAKVYGLKLQFVLSFHQCGTNVGDECFIELPKWLTKDDIWYKTRSGVITKEYISLWADNVVVDSFQRTPMMIYKEFMKEFQSQLVRRYPSSIEEITIGAGPAGELRYPSYQLQANRWKYCGIGEFQSYDSYALASLRKFANSLRKPNWANEGGPKNAGPFNCRPINSDTCSFFQNGLDNFQTKYGTFYLQWYSKSLLTHARLLLQTGRKVFGENANLAMKIAGIHWWYDTPHHGAELTAGYYNTNGKNAYEDIAKLLYKHRTIFCFTCLEMYDSPDCDVQDEKCCKSKPATLVGQSKNAVQKVTSGKLSQYYGGENALPIQYENIEQIAHQAQGTRSFTFLRLTQNFDYSLLKTLVSKLE